MEIGPVISDEVASVKSASPAGSRSVRTVNGYVLAAPPPGLSDVVDRLWVVQPRPALRPAERRLPDGAAELVIRLDGGSLRVWEDGSLQELGSAVIAGPHSRAFAIDTSEPMHLVGVHFRPGGAFPFLGLRADELHNRHAELSSLWGREADLMRDQLGSLDEPDEQMDVLARALQARLEGFRHRHPAVPRALRVLSTAASIEDVARDVDLSWRRLIELFRQEVGLTPKLFLRLQRFQNLLRKLETGEPIDWSDTALACGYYDQAHCIRDFRAFAALTPGRYAGTHRLWRNHVPI